MNDYIFNGKPHILSKDFGYISTLIDESKSTTFLEIKMIEMEMLKEYAKYLVENDKEKCLKIICQHLSFETNTDYTLIHRPSCYSCLHEFGCLSIKFKRLPNDNLE